MLTITDYIEEMYYETQPGNQTRPKYLGRYWPEPIGLEERSQKTEGLQEIEKAYGIRGEE